MHVTILVPMVLPGISTAFAIAFILAAGDFVVPSLVGGTQGVMVGNLVADQFKGFAPNWPLGAALAFTIMATVVVVQVATMRLIRWVTRR
jgi:spermidine/putrescine transport system permease protein